MASNAHTAKLQGEMETLKYDPACAHVGNKAVFAPDDSTTLRSLKPSTYIVQLYCEAGPKAQNANRAAKEQLAQAKALQRSKRW